MTITTRFASPADAATICDICSSAWRVTYKDLNTPDYIDQVIADFYNLDRVTKECSTSDPNWNGYMVAELDGQVLGAIGGGVSGDSLGQIYVLYVHPDHKGKGLVFTRLVYAAELLADGQNIQLDSEEHTAYLWVKGKEELAGLTLVPYLEEILEIP